MTAPAKQGLGALTEKEKATLRLIVRGHDAKSVARTLGLSVHTINERLRDARRKVAVTSSREAARLLFEAEAAAVLPQSGGDNEIGDGGRPLPVEEEPAPIVGVRRRWRRWLIPGVTLMLPALALLTLVTMAEVGSPPAAAPAAIDNPAAVDAAQRFLTLIDASRWPESYAATGAAFRKVNTVKLWADTSAQVRAPLGAMVTRTLISAENVPAPPHGVQVVKFRTKFASKEVVETVTLDQERGAWRVVGIGLD